MVPTLVLHGGAGRMADLDAAAERRYRAALRAAAEDGAAVLRRGGCAQDAVVAATVCMEDSGAFNAGLGACLTQEGDVEMDAAVMVGEQRGFAAVAGITGVANPVEVAARLLAVGPHAVLHGEGATRFAHGLGLRFREQFPGEDRRREWARRKALRARGGTGLEELGAVLGSGQAAPALSPGDAIGPSDTVGAAAVDGAGRFAAAISTGGLWLKAPGRLGDVPLPGAGIWVDPARGAAVCTGIGEAILRALLAREAVGAMQGPAAADAGCAAGLALLEGFFGRDQAGLVGLDARGEPGFALNTRGMGRALWRSGGAVSVAVWADEGWGA